MEWLQDTTNGAVVIALVGAVVGIFSSGFVQWRLVKGARRHNEDMAAANHIRTMERVTAEWQHKKEQNEDVERRRLTDIRRAKLEDLYEALDLEYKRVWDIIDRYRPGSDRVPASEIDQERISKLAMLEQYFANQKIHDELDKWDGFRAKAKDIAKSERPDSDKEVELSDLLVKLTGVRDRIGKELRILHQETFNRPKTNADAQSIQN
ncbi:MAG: hypothetical protein ACR2PG_05650 [Hyphomicrobiaceae bacterium]